MSPSKELSDGGVSADESPFQVTSDIEISATDQYRILFDEWVVAPLKIIWNDYRARLGITIVLVYLAVGLIPSLYRAGVLQALPSSFASYFAPPTVNDGSALTAPFEVWGIPLGTDMLGRGLMRQLIYATPAMLKMGLGGAAFSTVLATVWGTFAGYKGGTVDRVMMTIADMVMTIPGLPLIIVLAAIFEPRNPYLVGIVLSVAAWAGFARVLRSQVLTIRQESYVEASRAMGITRHTIISRDVLPNLMPLIVVHFVTRARGVIMASVALYFLGVLPFSTFNWGVMMNMAYSNGNAMYDMRAAHWFLFPMIAIVILSFGLILFGQGMDRVFNPRIRARHEKHTESGDNEDGDEPEESTEVTVLSGGQ